LERNLGGPQGQSGRGVKEEYCLCRDSNECYPVTELGVTALLALDVYYANYTCLVIFWFSPCTFISYDLNTTIHELVVKL